MMFYDFDWDDSKARTNLAKHGVSFRMATSVFRDPLALTIFDEEHSAGDERWITLGQAQNGRVLVVVHTFQAAADQQAHIRIISARRADPAEVRDYEQTPR